MSTSAECSTTGERPRLGGYTNMKNEKRQVDADFYENTFSLLNSILNNTKCSLCIETIGK
jgi:hypothetical protein